MAIIGNVVVSVMASTKGLAKQLIKGQKRLKDFAKKAIKTLTGIGAAVTAGVAGAVGAGIAVMNSYAEKIDKIAKTSSKLGIGVGELQKLQYQAELTGVSAGNLNTALQRMVRRSAEAAKGTGAAKDALKELGLDAKELVKLSPEKQFYAISEAMQGISDQGHKVRLAMKIFDTEGVGLVNTMNGNLQQMGEEFDKLGAKITNQQAGMVEAYNDSKTRLSAIFSSFGIQLTAQLAEPFQKLITFISDTIVKMGGLEEAAKKFAGFMLKSIKLVLSGVAKLIDAFGSLESVMLKIEKLSLQPGIMAEAVGSAITGSREIGSRAERSLEIDRQLAANAKKTSFQDSDFAKGLDNLLYDLTKNVTDGGVMVLDKHTAAVDETVKAVEKQKKSLLSASESAKVFDNTLKKVNETLGAGTSGGDEIIKGTYERDKLGLSAVSFARGTAGDIVEGSAAKTAVEGARKGEQSIAKFDINMQTDAGKISGQLFGEPKFISSLRNFTEKQTNQEARAATV